MPINTTPTIGAKLKPKYNTNVKPKLTHAETALLLSKLKSMAQKASDNEGEAMYVYGKNGVKITLWTCLIIS